MRSRPYLLILGVLGALALGCPKVVVTKAPRAGFSPPDPAPEEAAVVFLQPSRQAGTHAAVYEDGAFIGLVMDRTFFVHRATPGRHRYMAASEAADFLDAELEGGLVYFVRVKPRFGVRYARFTLLPLSPDRARWSEVAGWLAASREARPNAAGRGWVEEHADDVAELERAYLRKWLAKPERPTLRASDGVPASDL